MPCNTVCMRKTMMVMAALVAVSVTAPAIVQASPEVPAPRASSSEAAPATRAPKKQPLRSLKVQISGLPKGVKAKVRVTGPKRYKKILTSTKTLTKLRPGKYTITPHVVGVSNKQVSVGVSKAKVKISRKSRAKVNVRYRVSNVVEPLRFDFSNTAALAVGKTVNVRSAPSTRTSPQQTAPGERSNLTVVEGSGRTRDAVTSGSTEVLGAWIAPDRSTYVEVRQVWPETCYFFRIAAGDTVPSCVEAGRTGLSNAQRFYGPNSLPAVQFDAQGRVYYLSSPAQSSEAPSVRRYDNGAVTAMSNSQSNVFNFVVTPDGNVFISGNSYPSATSSVWLRRVRPSGQIDPIVSESVSLLGRFPDGNVYFVYGQGAIRRYLTGSSTLDPTPWTQSPPNPSMSTPRGAGVVTVGNKVFSSNAYSGAGLWQLYPAYNAKITSVTESTTMAAAGIYVVVGGRDSQGRQVLTRFDTNNESETSLLGPNQIEIYHLASVSAGRIVFDGLRFSDGQYVLGSIDVATGQVTIDTANDHGWVTVTGQQ